MALKPSSSVEGFFQQPPVLGNQYIEDEAFQRTLEYYLPAPELSSFAPELHSTARLALTPSTLDALADTENHPPTLTSHSSFGHPISTLVTPYGWKHLQRHTISLGLASRPHEPTATRYARIQQFALHHIWGPSSANTTCPTAMTDGAAKILRGHRSTHADFENAFRRLTSRGPEAWTSGQWMTERKGGSDVSGTETVATYDPENERAELGDWSISGFKWFSSATDANMALLLAQTQQGLSLFYAPMYLPKAADTEDVRPKSNGVRIQRLKSKLGTRGLPTAELELVGMRGRLIGREGFGVKEISTVLNITRVHTAVGAMSGWGRGLAVARAYSKVRLIKGGRQRLIDTPAHVATLAKQIVDYRGWLMFTFATVSLLGREEWAAAGQTEGHADTQPSKAYFPDDPVQVSLLLRVMTPIAKALTSKAAIAGLQECMEALGGVGYLENNESDPSLNIARLYRDNNVLSIWEGTTDIMADDLIRVLKGKSASSALDALAAWLDELLQSSEARVASELKAKFQDWKTFVEEASTDALKAQGRECMQTLGGLVVTALLMHDANGNMAPTGDPEADQIATEVAARWFSKIHGDSSLGQGDWQAEFEFNRRLVEGPRHEESPKSRL